MEQEKARCPSCGNNSVRKRGVNTPGNIRRRKVKDRSDRYVCDNCEWTGDRDEIDWHDKVPDSANSAMEW